MHPILLEAFYAEAGFDQTVVGGSKHQGVFGPDDLATMEPRTVYLLISKTVGGQQVDHGRWHAARRNSSSHALFPHPSFSKSSRSMADLRGKPNPAPTNSEDRHSSLPLKPPSINQISALPPHVAPFSILLREPHPRWEGLPWNLFQPALG